MSNETGQFGNANNPYQAPRSAVADVSQQVAVGTLIEGGQAVPAGNAMQWLAGGWALFKEAPVIWIVNILILFVLMMVMAFIPILGGLALNILMPVFLGGLLIGCRAIDSGQALEIGHLFAGFKEKFGPLALVGVLYLVGAIVIAVVIGVIGMVVVGASFFGALAGAGANSPEAAGALAAGGVIGVMLLVLLAMALMIPLIMAFLFAPALVVFHNLDAIEAMKQSFTGCLRNIVPFLLWGIVATVLWIVGMIPFMLGLLIVGPMLHASLYAAYKDIYLRA